MINLFLTDHSDAYPYGLRKDPFIKVFPFLGRDFFLTKKFISNSFLRKNHSGGNHWASQRASSHLIHPSNPLVALAIVHLLKIIHRLDWKGREEHQNTI